MPSQSSSATEGGGADPGRHQRHRFDSVGGGPFYLTPGSMFERRPDKFGIRILDPVWCVRQHVDFYDPAHEYFATATLTQPQMKELAAAFRQQIEARHAACWNLSDYALLCWLSAGGTATSLTDLWKRPEEQMTSAEQQVIGVLKEKDGRCPTRGRGVVRGRHAEPGSWRHAAGTRMVNRLHDAA